MSILKCHVDDFVDDTFPAMDVQRRRAAYILAYHRLPAHLQGAFREFMTDLKLACTYLGARYWCVGASRLGDVFLTTVSPESPYQFRVDVSKCTEWSDKLEIDLPTEPLA